MNSQDKLFQARKELLEMEEKNIEEGIRTMPKESYEAILKYHVRDLIRINKLRRVKK